MFVRDDLHRTADTSRWLSPKGFSVVTRKERRSILDSLDGGNSTNLPFVFGQGGAAEPYEDPKLQPDFVRSEKEFLK